MHKFAYILTKRAFLVSDGFKDSDSFKFKSASSNKLHDFLYSQLWKYMTAIFTFINASLSLSFCFSTQINAF